MEKIKNFFNVEEKDSSIRTEVLAGITLFMTMAYIVIVNPSILGDAISEEAIPALTVATGLAAGVATILMGVWANKPFGLAPGMGLNAYFAYTIVLEMGIPWQTALGLTFIQGIIFLALTWTGFRNSVVRAIPLHQKYAIGAGIGLFLTLIGLKDAGIVIADPATGIAFNTELGIGVLVAVIGLLLAAILMVKGLQGSLLIGIIAATIIAIPLGVAALPEQWLAMPTLDYTFGEFARGLTFEELLTWPAVIATFSLWMVDFYDTLGTVTGLSAKAGYLTDEGGIQDSKRVLSTDAIGTIFGSILGTSTVTTYIESAAGIGEGGKTGLTAVTTGVLLMIFGVVASGFVHIIPEQATAVALVLVGFLMMTQVTNIDFKKYEEGIPAFLIIAAIPLTYNISVGIGAGFISYVVLKSAKGEYDEIHTMMWVSAFLFLMFFLAYGGVFA